ncbi:hypothetical protein [Vibrio breoganii]|uniref:Uncharacterized protein n=1 Tax=Vibrio breoganii TaxID=553239 RepID=A0ABX1UC97_9VIBR|nr:hypothetical protein [Vibrio breoganii]NMO74840.1 hypothetical protein [Vibrio breoganii]NMR71342.1 hypothetical protein [Vibrio breoganii]
MALDELFGMVGMEFVFSPFVTLSLRFDWIEVDSVRSKILSRAQDDVTVEC